MSRYSQVIEGESGLLDYLPIDAEWLLSDRSGNNQGGVAGGGITIGGAGGPGDLSATDFDGVDDRVTTGLSPFVSGSTRTFEGWANRDTSASADVLFGG